MIHRVPDGTSGGGGGKGDTTLADLISAYAARPIPVERRVQPQQSEAAPSWRDLVRPSMAGGWGSAASSRMGSVARSDATTANSAISNTAAMAAFAPNPANEGWLFSAERGWNRSLNPFSKAIIVDSQSQSASLDTTTGGPPPLRRFSFQTAPPRHSSTDDMDSNGPSSPHGGLPQTSRCTFSVPAPAVASLVTRGPRPPPRSADSTAVGGRPVVPLQYPRSAYLASRLAGTAPTFASPPPQQGGAATDLNGGADEDEEERAWWVPAPPSIALDTPEGAEAASRTTSATFSRSTSTPFVSMVLQKRLGMSTNGGVRMRRFLRAQSAAQNPWATTLTVGELGHRQKIERLGDARRKLRRHLNIARARRDGVSGVSDLAVEDGVGDFRSYFRRERIGKRKSALVTAAALVCARQAERQQLQQALVEHFADEERNRDRNRFLVPAHRIRESAAVHSGKKDEDPQGASSDHVRCVVPSSLAEPSIAVRPLRQTFAQILPTVPKPPSVPVPARLVASALAEFQHRYHNTGGALLAAATAQQLATDAGALEGFEAQNYAHDGGTVFGTLKPPTALSAARVHAARVASRHCGGGLMPVAALLATGGVVGASGDLDDELQQVLDYRSMPQSGPAGRNASTTTADPFDILLSDTTPLLSGDEATVCTNLAYFKQRMLMGGCRYRTIRSNGEEARRQAEFRRRGGGSSSLGSSSSGDSTLLSASDFDIDEDDVVNPSPHDSPDIVIDSADVPTDEADARVDASAAAPRPTMVTLIDADVRTSPAAARGPKAPPTTGGGAQSANVVPRTDSLDSLVDLLLDAPADGTTAAASNTTEAALVSLDDAVLARHRPRMLEPTGRRHGRRRRAPDLSARAVLRVFEELHFPEYTVPCFTELLVDGRRPQHGGTAVMDATPRGMSLSMSVQGGIQPGVGGRALRGQRLHIRTPLSEPVPPVDDLVVPEAERPSKRRRDISAAYTRKQEIIRAQMRSVEAFSQRFLFPETRLDHCPAAVAANITHPPPRSVHFSPVPAPRSGEGRFLGQLTGSGVFSLSDQLPPREVAAAVAYYASYRHHLAESIFTLPDGPPAVPSFLKAVVAGYQLFIRPCRQGCHPTSFSGDVHNSDRTSIEGRHTITRAFLRAYVQWVQARRQRGLGEHLRGAIADRPTIFGGDAREEAGMQGNAKSFHTERLEQAFALLSSMDTRRDDLDDLDDHSMEASSLSMLSVSHLSLKVTQPLPAKTFDPDFLFLAVAPPLPWCAPRGVGVYPRLSLEALSGVLTPGLFTVPEMVDHLQMEILWQPPPIKPTTLFAALGAPETGPGPLSFGAHGAPLEVLEDPSEAGTDHLSHQGASSPAESAAAAPDANCFEIPVVELISADSSGDDDSSSTASSADVSNKRRTSSATSAAITAVRPTTTQVFDSPTDVEGLPLDIPRLSSPLTLPRSRSVSTSSVSAASSGRIAPIAASGHGSSNTSNFASLLSVPDRVGSPNALLVSGGQDPTATNSGRASRQPSMVLRRLVSQRVASTSLHTLAPMPSTPQKSTSGGGLDRRASSSASAGGVQAALAKSSPVKPRAPSVAGSVRSATSSRASNLNTFLPMLLCLSGHGRKQFQRLLRTMRAVVAMRADEPPSPLLPLLTPSLHHLLLKPWSQHVSQRLATGHGVSARHHHMRLGKSVATAATQTVLLAGKDYKAALVTRVSYLVTGEEPARRQALLQAERSAFMGLALRARMLKKLLQEAAFRFETLRVHRALVTAAEEEVASERAANAARRSRRSEGHLARPDSPRGGTMRGWSVFGGGGAAGSAADRHLQALSPSSPIGDRHVVSPSDLQTLLQTGLDFCSRPPVAVARSDTLLHELCIAEEGQRGQLEALAVAAFERIIVQRHADIQSIVAEIDAAELEFMVLQEEHRLSTLKRQARDQLSLTAKFM